ncbi:hypothetical protein V8F33_010590 [Rhypophila sp. PSN 637]
MARTRIPPNHAQHQAIARAKVQKHQRSEQRAKDKKKREGDRREKKIQARSSRSSTTNRKAPAPAPAPEDDDDNEVDEVDDDDDDEYEQEEEEKKDEDEDEDEDSAMDTSTSGPLSSSGDGGSEEDLPLLAATAVMVAAEAMSLDPEPQASGEDLLAVGVVSDGPGEDRGAWHDNHPLRAAPGREQVSYPEALVPPWTRTNFELPTNWSRQFPTFPSSTLFPQVASTTLSAYTHPHTHPTNSCKKLSAQETLAVMPMPAAQQVTRSPSPGSEDEMGQYAASGVERSTREPLSLSPMSIRSAAGSPEVPGGDDDDDDDDVEMEDVSAPEPDSDPTPAVVKGKGRKKGKARAPPKAPQRAHPNPVTMMTAAARPKESSPTLLPALLNGKGIPRRSAPTAPKPSAPASPLSNGNVEEEDEDDVMTERGPPSPNIEEEEDNVVMMDVDEDVGAPGHVSSPAPRSPVPAHSPASGPAQTPVPAAAPLVPSPLAAAAQAPAPVSVPVPVPAAPVPAPASPPAQAPAPAPPAQSVSGPRRSERERRSTTTPKPAAPSSQRVLEIEISGRRLRHPDGKRFNAFDLLFRKVGSAEPPTWESEDELWKTYEEDILQYWGSGNRRRALEKEIGKENITEFYLATIYQHKVDTKDGRNRADNDVRKYKYQYGWVGYKHRWWRTWDNMADDADNVRRHYINGHGLNFKDNGQAVPPPDPNP